MRCFLTVFVAVILSLSACRHGDDDSTVQSASTCEMYVEGYRYDAATQQCRFVSGSGCSRVGYFDTLEACQAAAPQKAADDLVVAPTGGCTKDLNEWRNPSHCGCPVGYKYSPILGQCRKAAGL